MLSYLLKQPPAPPSGDKRWKLVGATMRRYGYESYALIETMHAVQEAFGFLDEEALRFVAASLRVPLSRVYGVATFYHYFTLKPQGRHTCVLCTGTACYIKGSSKNLAAVEDKYKIKPGDTTKDDNLSLLTARCLGSCGLAPAGVFDGEVVAKLTPDLVMGRIARWMP
ncbi:MAG: bidirectional hydrogenase complex protein HoxE [Candidatus Hydrogenedentes bacterium]|nr:bidirectional hydrogenase complex protein HoxE [Candidatus Hydrogenedentota bacterium]